MSNTEQNKLCLHCPLEQRQGRSIPNFAKHLLKAHNNRYQELKAVGAKRCKRPEYMVDFEWAGKDQLSKKRQKLEPKSKEQEEDKSGDGTEIEGNPVVEQEQVLS